MEIDAVKLLNHLKRNNGLHNKISIAPLIDELVTNPPAFYEYQLVMKPLYQLMHKLQNYDDFINYDTPPSPNGSTYTWDIVKNIQVELTTKGDDYLKDNSRQDVEFELNKRLLESHELSQLVNKSVIDTNEKMVSITIDQSKTNKVIADNSTTQTNILVGQEAILKRQTLIFFFTAVFAFGALIVAAITLYRDIHKDTLQSQLKAQTKVIEAQKSRIKRLSADSVANSKKK